jgi:hypothetical protein
MFWLCTGGCCCRIAGSGLILVSKFVNKVYRVITSALAGLLDGCSQYQLSHRSLPAIPVLLQNILLVFIENL